MIMILLKKNLDINFICETTGLAPLDVEKTRTSIMLPLACAFLWLPI